MSMLSTLRPVLTAAALLGSLGAAQATMVAAVPEGPFNALVFGNFNSYNADIEGGLIVGGRVSLDTYGVNAKSHSSFGLWTQGGGTLSNGHIWGGYTNNMQLASNAGSTGAGAYAVGDSSRLFSMQSYYQSVSQSYAQTNFARTAYRDPWTGLVFEADKGAARHVFNVNAADLPYVRWLDIRNVDADEELVINVIGDSATFTNLDLSDSLGKYKTLLNYVDAKIVHFSATSPWADVLAPYATIVGGNGHIQGTIVAGAFDSQLEIHSGKTDFWKVPAGAVPEPGSMALAAVALLALVRTRRGGAPIRLNFMRPSAA